MTLAPLQIYAPQKLWRTQVASWIGGRGFDPTAWPYNADPTGTNDASAAFQAAIDAAKAVKGDVLVPPGTYKLATTLNFTDTVNFLCSGWGTVFKPSADGIGTMFNVTGNYVRLESFFVDASAIVTPTFTCIKVNCAGGLTQVSNIYIYGAGTGVLMPQGNACRFTDMRIQQCPVGVQTGGTTAIFPGDTTWTSIDVIPTTAGTGWIMDGNTNAQILNNVKTIGGATGLQLRGSGASTTVPEHIYIDAGSNFSASSGPVVQITKGRLVNFASRTAIGGSTGDCGVLIDAAANADVEGVIFDGCNIQGNFKEGIRWTGGANLLLDGGNINGNSNGGGSGVYSNIYVGASAVGLFMMDGVMAGLGSTGNVFAGAQAPTKYGVELASGALTDATNFPGRVFIPATNMLLGNTTGTILDASAPTGVNKFIGVIGSPGYLEFKVSVDFNAANTDTTIPIVLPNGYSRYVVREVRLSGASHDISTATAGLFTAAAGGGTAIVTAASAITLTATAENTANNAMGFAVNNSGTTSYNVATLYFRVATAEGAAATATATILIAPLS